ncbi:hypothetical protein OTU49_000119 [Cherax quadricarinatus]|uniref:Fibrinogen C-terminal domain-containing protein n=2 Tax=Cherax quadricarinatus TaxID=27406 RepID=A0AAW0Y2I8_CHEQU|nr:fibrinogen-like protein A isoform X2 [Cherax quadricarinatus]
MRITWACLWMGVLGVSTATNLNNLPGEAAADAQPFQQDAQPFQQDAQPFQQDSQPFQQDAQPFQQDAQPFQQDVQSFQQDAQPFQQDAQLAKDNEKNQTEGGAVRPSPGTSAARPRDCADHLIRGSTTSGIYEVYPFTCTCSQPVKVWCDMETDGGGWTVFLNRQKQTTQENFNRTWAEYKEGFGNLSGEYYLGNEFLYKLTARQDFAFRLDLEYQTSGNKYYTYSNVRVDNEASRYRLTSHGHSSGTVSSNCFHLGYYGFTTYDNYNVNSIGNCSSAIGGGWWYYSGCLYGNPTSSYNQGLNYTCYYSTSIVTKLQVKIRPSVCDTASKTVYINSKNCNSCQSSYN